MDSVTIISGVIGDFQEPYGAVLRGIAIHPVTDDRWIVFFLSSSASSLGTLR
jgi:hypothetical protein